MSLINLFARKHKQDTVQPSEYEIEYERIKKELIEVRGQKIELQAAREEFNELTEILENLLIVSLSQSAPIILDNGITVQDMIAYKKRLLRECEEEIYSLPGEPELQEQEDRLMKEFQNLQRTHL